MPGRDRERERDNVVGRSEFDRLQKGHDQLAAQLERVAAVAVRASSDAGEARADLQLVFFLQGRIRTKVMETLASYNSERPGILDGSRDKGPPLKCRIYEDLLAATLDQGAGQPTAVQALAALKDYPTGPAAIHSVGNLGKPREVKTHLGLCLYSSLGLARAAASVSCGPILTWAVSSAKVLTAGLIWDASLVGIAPPGPRNRSALTLASASLGRAAAKERPPGFPPRGLLPMPQMPGGREPDGSSAARPIDLPFWCVPVSSGRWGVVLPTTLLVVPVSSGPTLLCCCRSLRVAAAVAVVLPLLPAAPCAMRVLPRFGSLRVVLLPVRFGCFPPLLIPSSGV